MNPSKPLWHGIVLVAGGAVGAGMFALPMVSAGAWFYYAICGLILVWAITLIAATSLAKVNLYLVTGDKPLLPVESSFSNIVGYTLGPAFKALNNISIIFIMMILMYAYTTAGARIMFHSAEMTGVALAAELRPFISIGFALVIAAIVVVGTALVSRISLLFILLMVLLFVLAAFEILPVMQVSHLAKSSGDIQFLPSALPVYLTAFACGGLVPSLVRHYSLRPQYVKKSLVWGTLLSLCIYIIWLLITFTGIPRAEYKTVIENGANIASLVSVLSDKVSTDQLASSLNLFSHCAIITSFLSVAIGLFHFMQDSLGLPNTLRGKTLTAVACFLPSTVASVLFPYGFVNAIGFAALFVAFSFFCLPALMCIKLKNKMRVAWLVSISLLAFSAIIILLKLLSISGLLPEFSN